MDGLDCEQNEDTDTSQRQSCVSFEDEEESGQDQSTVFEFRLPTALAQPHMSLEPEDNNGRKTPSAQNDLRVTLIKVVFLKIEDINTVNECFSGLFFMKAKWREPALDTTSVREIHKINWDTLWNPQLGINNVLGNATVKTWNDVEFGPNGEAYAVEKRRVKGTFTEKMELMDFPFDVQDLSLLITSELPEDEIALQEDEDDISNVVTDSFVDETEWHLKKFVQSEARVTDDMFVQKRYRKPGLFFRCCVIRRAGFFIWNIMLVMSIISALSFVTFAVERNLPQNRGQMSFILVLAGVTFKFAASQSVPKISYLTNLDRYIIGSMIFLFLVAVWHGVVSTFDYEDSDGMDLYAFIAFAVLYVLLHGLFIVSQLVRGWKKRREIHKIEKRYLDRLKDVNIKAGLQEKKKPKRTLTKNRISVRGGMKV